MPIRNDWFAACIAFLLTLLPFAAHMNAQCALAGSDSCETATPICRPQFCDSLGLNIPDGPHNGWCGSNTAIHNPRYYAFTAATGTVTITISVDDCTGGQHAIQAAIIEACPWTNADVLACDPGTSEGDTFQLQASGLIIGNPYWLVVDGSATSVCGYTITDTEGISYADDVPLLDSVTAEVSDVCPGFKGLLVQAEPTPGVHGYLWVAAWAPADTLHSDGPSIEVDVPENTTPGPYAICVRAYSACDTADLESCTIIHVLPRADTTSKDTIRLCPDAFPFMWNETLIDGPGTYFSTAYSPDSCALDSTWTILPQDSLPIIEIAAQAGPCVTDSSFVALVDVFLPSEDLPLFDLLAGTVSLGQYSVDDFPLLIDDFPGNGTGQYSVSVCRPGSTSPECCTTYSFIGPSCPGSSCQLTSPGLMQTPCSPAQTVDFLLSFSHAHAGSSGFTVVCDGRLFGPYTYADLPVRFGPFAGDGSAYPILVLDNEDPSCNLALTSAPVECTTSIYPPERTAQSQVIVLGNGGIPVIQATKDIRVSVHSTDGRIMLQATRLLQGDELSLAPLPQGFYLALILGQAGCQTITLARTQY